MTRPIDMKTLAQPYNATLAELQDLLNPVRTTAQLGAIADEINTVDKRVGRTVFNSDTGLLVVADASTPGGTWSSVSDGLVDHTPS